MIYIKDDFLPKNLLNAIIKDKSDLDKQKKIKIMNGGYIMIL